MRRYRISLIFLCLIFAACLALPGTAQVRLTMQLVAPSNLQVFFLEDLNISGQAPSSEVFRATINNTSGHPYENAYFVFSMSSSRMGEILHGESNWFTLSQRDTVITNLTLTEEGSQWELKEYEISPDADDIEQKLLQTGYFPSDLYTLRLELHVPGLPVVSDEVSVIITNPFDINLVTPFGTPASPALLSVTTPLFIWSSSATEFLLKICEKTSEGMDPESVMQSRPNYETPGSDPLVGQSFPYPGSGVRPLEPGRTYYWQVTSLVQTSSGLKEYPSDISAFSIMEYLDPDAQRVLLTLQQILGLNYADVMDQLSGFQPTGTILLDGAAVTIEEFEQTAQKLLMGEYQTTAVYAE